MDGSPLEVTFRGGWRVNGLGGGGGGSFSSAKGVWLETAQW